MATQTVGEIILDVSTHLNDQQPGFPYARWTQAELLEFENDALIQVGIYRPDAYCTSTTILLTPGYLQFVPTGYSVLKSCDYNATGGPCAGAPIIQCDLKILRAFFKMPCTPTGGQQNYRVRTYAYDPANPLIFYVSPPVPTWATPEITITAVKDAPQYTLADLAVPIAIDQKYTNAIIAWMMMKAYEVDTESVSSARQAAEQRSHFYQMLGVSYKQESRFQSGYFLGQRGDKDPQASTR